MGEKEKSYSELHQELELLKAENRLLKEMLDNIQKDTSHDADINRSAAFYRHLLDVLMDTLSHSIYFKDLDSRFIFCNQSKAEKSGYNSPEEMLGLTDFNTFSKEHAQQAYEDEQLIITTQKALINIVEKETWEDRPDNWVSTNKYPLYSSTGELMGTFGISHDVTDIVMAERALKKSRDELEKRVAERTLQLAESEHKYRMLAEFSSDTIFNIETDGNIKYCSPSVSNLLNYDVEEIIDTSFYQYTDNQFKDRIDHIFNEESSQITNIRAITKSGEKIWVEISSSPVIENSKIVSVICIARDVTANMNYQNELLKLQRAVEFSPATILITNADGIIVYVNKKFIELTGYSKEEAIGQNPRILKSGLMEPETYDGLWSTLSDGKEWRGEILNRKKNGELYWETANISAVKNIGDEITHFMAIKEDITDRKKREEEKLKDEKRLSAIISIMQRDFSDVKELLELSLEEAIKLTDSKIGYIYHYNEDANEFILNSWSKNVMKECEIIEPRTTYQLNKTGIWGEVVRQRKPLIVNEFESFHPFKKGYPEGHVELKKFMSIPVYEYDRIVAVVGVANKSEDYNSTDLLQLTLLMNSVWILVSRIQMNHTLIDKNQILQETNAQKDKFFSIISHDLRSPFSILMDLSKLIYDNYSELTDQQRLDYLEMIHKSSTKTYNLLENLLEWAQTKQGLIRYSPAVYNLYDIGYNVYLNMDFQFKSKGLTFKLDIHDPTKIFADERMLKTIIRNLLANSIKFTGEGGTIQLTAKNEEDVVQVAIIDSGTGMNKAQLEKLFSYNMEGGTFGTRGEKGSGLGLLLCKEFVRLNGGEIRVESEEGKGSTFFFTIPKG